MRCVRASDAAGSSRRQPEVTHEVIRQVEVASQHHPKIENLLQYPRLNLVCELQL